MLLYLAPWDRLVVSLSEGAAADSDLAAFLRAPVAYILGLPDVRVKRIVLVPPSDGPAAAPLSSPDGRRPPEFTLRHLKILSDDSMDEEEENGGRDAGLADRHVVVLAPGGTLTLPNLWEFVPFNDPALASLATQAFRDAAEPWAEILRTADNAQTRAEALAALKGMCTDTFGSNSDRKNLISLFQ